MPSPDPGHYDLNWVFEAVSPRPWIKWLLMFWEDSSPASTAWLFSPGYSGEKPHNLFRGHPRKKTSFRPWFEIAGWARSYFRYSECVKLFPKYLGFNTATEAAHQISTPAPNPHHHNLWLWNMCVRQINFFWFWWPYTNCQHTASFSTALWCTWRDFIPWTRSHNSKCV